MVPNRAMHHILETLVGDSAFPFRTWLVKTFTRYFDYCLSRARMVTERVYGHLKRLWETLLRKYKNKKETLKLHTITCVCLHNLCIELNDSALTNWDVSKGNRIT